MDAESTLLKDIAIIMAVAGASIAVFRRFGQPAILGYLIAGLLIGPFTLPDPLVEDVETIRVLADLGLVVLLFALGLELGWERIRQVGARVVVIGVIEMSFMLAIGYELGILMGWTVRESIFLGAALSISSSAVLVKVLRDTGQLHDTHGRLIVGILVVEDFAAVVLLTILSGIAATGSASPEEVGLLAGKLALFGLAALALGALIAPRVVGLASRLHSPETLLIVSLACCFGLAFIAQELGLSAAAGAFLIGAVLGDTREAQRIQHLMSPVRDMFSALFFVSIGMLIDPFLVGQHLVPALIVSIVFVVGKIVSDTTGTFATGHDGRTSLRVGMGMPQIGEFSLAMVKVGAERAAIGAFLYPVVTMATAITSFVYPYLFRSALPVARFLEHRSPRLLRLYLAYLSHWLMALRSSFSLEGQMAETLKHTTRAMMINVAIVMLFVGIGTVTVGFASELGGLVGLAESLVALFLGVGVLALCVPSSVAIWRELHSLSKEVTAQLFARMRLGLRRWREEQLQEIVQHSISTAVVLLLVIWAVPFISQLLMIGEFSAPLPLVLLLLAVFVTARTAFKVHRILEGTFRRTLLGQDETGTQVNQDDGG